MKEIALTESPLVNKKSCQGCNSENELGFEFEYAFQPIVNLTDMSIYAHEALVRGPNGEGAFSVLNQVTQDNLYKFDQACRVKAVKTAAAINLDGYLSINFLPNAVYRPELCIRTTLEAANTYNFPANKIIFELTESEQMVDINHLITIFEEYKKLGFKTALDDLGSGYSGLIILAKIQPDIVKIDMELIRNIHLSKPRQAIVKALITMALEMKIAIIAEGIEIIEERDFLTDHGVNLMQGYLFAKPAFKAKGMVDDKAWL